MKFKIGVFGSGDGGNPRCIGFAKDLGYHIADNEGILITGACGGLPHQAACSATRQRGLVIGISPALNLEEHIDRYGFPFDSFYNLIFTGMGMKGRNVISLRSCDAAIFISGRIGTLNEFTIAYDEAPKGFIIGILKGSGGVADKLLTLAEESGKNSKATLIVNEHPYYLVKEIFEKLFRQF